MSSVLVTGGSGFVGVHTILQLLAAGHVVRTTVRHSDRREEVLAMLGRGGVSSFERLSFFTATRSDRSWPPARAS